MRRFWDVVGVEKQGDALTVTLDNRALKTPSGNTLLLPQNKTLLASLIAAEWDHQKTLLKPHALPVVSFSGPELCLRNLCFADFNSIAGGRCVKQRGGPC
jgi:chaperone required for assembly of F1-ATPase